LSLSGTYLGLLRFRFVGDIGYVVNLWFLYLP